MNKIILSLLLFVFSAPVLAFETLDSTLSILKRTGIEAGGKEYKCPDGFMTSAEKNKDAKLYSYRECTKEISPDHTINISIDLIVPAKLIGRIYLANRNLEKNAKPCSLEFLKKFIGNRKVIKEVNQHVEFETNKDTVSSVSCLKFGYVIDIQTKIWKEIMK